MPRPVVKPVYKSAKLLREFILEHRLQYLRRIIIDLTEDLFPGCARNFLKVVQDRADSYRYSHPYRALKVASLAVYR